MRRIVSTTSEWALKVAERDLSAVLGTISEKLPAGSFFCKSWALINIVSSESAIDATSSKIRLVTCRTSSTPRPCRNPACASCMSCLVQACSISSCAAKRMARRPFAPFFARPSVLGSSLAKTNADSKVESSANQRSSSSLPSTWKPAWILRKMPPTPLSATQ